MKRILLIAAVLAPAAASALNLSGEWKIDSTAGTTPIIIDCVLRQTGNALAGNCAPRSEGSTPVALTGSVDGTRASWGYSVVFRGNPGTMAFDASLATQGFMQGTLKLDGKPTPFRANRPSVEDRLQRLQDESEIRAMLQDYMGLLTSRDWDSYVKLFSTDSDLDMAEGVVHGRDAIRTRMANATERMAKAAAGKPVHPRVDLLTNINVHVTGDSATASSRFTFIAENDAQQFMVTGSGLYLDSLIREEGAWRIRRRQVKWDLLAGH